MLKDAPENSADYRWLKRGRQRLLVIRDIPANLRSRIKKEDQPHNKRPPKAQLKGDITPSYFFREKGHGEMP
ncbi:MAG: hypothetical protein ABIB71_00755 [Candidatus Woesearchaeota archaeon]